MNRKSRRYRRLHAPVSTVQHEYLVSYRVENWKDPSGHYLGTDVSYDTDVIRATSPAAAYKIACGRHIAKSNGWYPSATLHFMIINIIKLK
jgi:hypothetical protein